jgi:urease accessory protein
MNTTATATTDSAIARLRLLQLTSPALPVGAYAYSQGLEQAIEAGWVTGPDELQDWVGGLLQHNLCTLDIPVLLRLHAAWCAHDQSAVRHWNGWLHACRESAELQTEDRQLGSALARLLADLGVDDARPWLSDAQTTYATLFALGAAHWHIEARDMALGYLWSWCENQIMAALKLMPLGQTAGQRILSALIERLPAALQCAEACADADIGQLATAQAIASARHETQYSRLFRS